MNVTIHIITSKEDEFVYNEICGLFKNFYSHLSISPYRPYAGMKDSLEFFVTLSIDRKHLLLLLDKLSNEFDVGEYEDEWEFCWA